MYVIGDVHTADVEIDSMTHEEFMNLFVNKFTAGLINRSTDRHTQNTDLYFRSINADNTALINCRFR